MDEGQREGGGPFVAGRGLFLDGPRGESLTHGLVRLAELKVAECAHCRGLGRQPRLGRDRWAGPLKEVEVLAGTNGVTPGQQVTCDR